MNGFPDAKDVTPVEFSKPVEAGREEPATAFRMRRALVESGVSAEAASWQPNP
jgi:hypothetical protein